MILGIEASHANRLKRTGVEEYCFQIIQHLKSVIPADTRVILYSEKKLIPPLSDLPHNWQSKIIKWPAIKGWSQFALSKYFFNNPPDVFFAPGQLVPFICPKNTVTTVHDSAFVVYPSAYSFFGRQYLKIMNRMILNKSKKIITPSLFSKNELIRIYDYSSPKKISVVYHGYDKEKYKLNSASEEKKNELLKKYNITKPFYFFVGRLEEKKNVAVMVRAFEKIKKNIDAQLVLVGSCGQGSNKILSAIDTSAYKNDIILTGWAHETEIPVFFNSAIALMFPTKYEGFGFPLLYALASGCPSIASKGSSLEEIGGEAVIYVHSDSLDEIAESSIKLFLDKDFREKIIENGLKRADLFDWNKTAEQTWQILREAGK